MLPQRIALHSSPAPAPPQGRVHRSAERCASCQALEHSCWRRYGAYEVSNDPDFSRNELSLIDRGFVYAIAHVRGGGEMGRQWYEVRCLPQFCTVYSLSRAGGADGRLIAATLHQMHCRGRQHPGRSLFCS